MTRRTLLFLISAPLALFATTGCLKDTPATNLTNLGTVIEMMYPGGAQDNGVGTGMEFFTGDQQIIDPATGPTDTIVYYANIAGPKTLSKALAVTMAVNDSDLQDNFANDGVTYLAFPDSCYSLLKTTGSIPAGQRIDTFQAVVYNNTIDLTQNYGAPIQLSAPGYTVAANFSILYLHTLGAPMGGNYNDSVLIYPDSAGTGTAVGGQLGPVGYFVPLDNNDAEIPSGDTTQIGYILSFNNTGGIASGFSISIDPNTIPSGASIIGGPNIIDSVAATNTYKFSFIINMGSYEKNVTDTYTFVSKY